MAISLMTKGKIVTQVKKKSYRDTVYGKDSSTMGQHDANRASDEVDIEFTAEMFERRIVIDEKVLDKHECPVFTLSKWEEARIQKP